MSNGIAGRSATSRSQLEGSSRPQLLEAIVAAEDEDEDRTIYATALAPDAEAVLLTWEEAGEGKVQLARDGRTYLYLLEAALVREVLEVEVEHRGRELVADEKLRAVLHYAEFDAYL